MFLSTDIICVAHEYGCCLCTRCAALSIKVISTVGAPYTQYYAVFNSAAYGRCLLIFSPNEQILEGMKRYLNKDIVLKLFYNRNAG